MSRVRLDWVTTVSRQSVDVARLNTDEVFHYSIPVIEATGDGAVESVEHIDSSKLLLEGGEVLISKLNPRKARVLIAQPHDIPTVCSGEFIPLIPLPAIDRRYLWWRLLSNDVTQELGSQVRSVTRSHQRIDPIVLTKLWFDLPALEKQKQIVSFLDSKCAYIDELMREQMDQRSLLEEHFRAALVSRFIREDRSKISSMTRLKYLFEFDRGGIWGDEPTGDDDDVTCIRVADFDRFTFRAGKNSETRRSIPKNQAEPRLLRAGDVLLEKSGGTQDKPVGCAVTYEGEGRAVCSNFVAQLRPRAEHNGRFIGLLMAAHYQAKLNSPYVKQTTGIQNLDSSGYLGEYAHVPGRAEQDAIVVEVERELDLAMRAAAELERSVALLNERRSAIITAAVTGQMEVA